MPPTPAVQHATANSATEQFLELVLADEQLLREEFDAIITQEKYEEALDYLNANLFPYVDKAGMTADQRRQLYR